MFQHEPQAQERHAVWLKDGGQNASEGNPQIWLASNFNGSNLRSAEVIWELAHKGVFAKGIQTAASEQGILG